MKNKDDEGADETEPLKRKQAAQKKEEPQLQNENNNE
jgi:hypothetical protein